MKRSSRRLVGAFLALVVAGMLWVIAWSLADSAPVKAFDGARAAMSEAREAEAERYAPDTFRAGEAAWSEALEMWREENRRFFLVRDYAAADSAANATLELAARARSEARTRRDSLRLMAQVGHAAVLERLNAVQGQVDRLPLHAGWRAAASRTRTLLAESEGAFAREDYLTAAEKAESALAALRRVDDGVQGSLFDYLAEMPAWQRWSRDTIRWSARTGSHAIVVDKMALRLHLYDSGRLVHSYPVELGPRWMGRKQVEGDHATPEGKYFVRRKRGRGETIYFRALEINYPNEEDKARFERARREGLLPGNARIGGQIEIHGEGGIGANWTRGCIALHNDDMKALFDQVGVSTPVTIVGALEVPDFLGGRSEGAPTADAVFEGNRDE